MHACTHPFVCVRALVHVQGAVAAVERRHADELREELQDTRDLCNFYQQENEELNMVSMLYQRQLDQLKQQQQQVAAPPPGGFVTSFDCLRVVQPPGDTACQVQSLR